MSEHIPMRAPTEAELLAVQKWWDEVEARGEEYDYVDNERFAVIGNTEDEKAYREAEARGCCGTGEVELTTADGVKFLFGFNHGH